MDIERAMEFLLEQQAASQARFDAQMADSKERFDAQMAESKARFDVEIAQINRTLAETAEIGRRTRAYLDRAVRAAVKEARAERERRREGDEKLAASHAALEASMKAYFDSLKNRTNGHDQ